MDALAGRTTDAPPPPQSTLETRGTRAIINFLGAAPHCDALSYLLALSSSLPSRHYRA